MRLKRIKLAGFKSFVDPTVIPFETNLSAIVGPNGCGKSNIIDAIRWVLGEISARELRGESMSDVIFNGSGNRKPISTASVEMIFDNSAGMFGGEYAAYNEIAVRREVVRDDASSYYINGTHCRRKDILDIFLGTGLGIHSYAIIEQGMIAKLIEAKPDELRLHLEEAAGISKYKERKRETENRIQHTKDNLLRLNDIKLEIENQLKVLKRQANAANIYKRLREEERLLKAKLQLCRWNILNEEINNIQNEINQIETQISDKTTLEHTHEAKLAELHIKQNAARDKVNDSQTKFYQSGTEVSAIEQRIFYAKKHKDELLQTLENLNRDFQDTLVHKNNDSEQLKLFHTELANLKLSEADLQKTLVKAEEDLRSAEEILKNWQLNFDKFNSEYTTLEKQLLESKSRFMHLMQTTDKDQSLLVKLDNEAKNLNLLSLEQKNGELSTADNELKAEIKSLTAALDILKKEISNVTSEKLALSDKLNVLRQNIYESTSKKDVLETLQNAELNTHDTKHVLENLFKNNGLTFEKRLINEIEVETGWEKAVEIVLNDHLKAIPVADWEILNPIGKTATINTSGLNFIVGRNAPSSQSLSISSKIKSALPINEMLAHIYTASNLDEALNMRLRIKPHESIVTQDGTWIGATWIKFTGNKNAQNSILEREKDLKTINKKLVTSQAELEKIEEELVKKEQEFKLEETKVLSSEQELKKLVIQDTETASALKVNSAHLEYTKKRLDEINTEITNTTNVIKNIHTQIEETKNFIKATEEKNNTLETEKILLLKQRNEYGILLEAARSLVRERKEVYANFTMRSNLILNQINHLEKNLERLNKQEALFNERKAEIEKNLKELATKDEELNPLLNTKLEERLLLEKDLITARTTLANVDAELAAKEKECNLVKDAILQIRNSLVVLVTKSQELKITSATHVGQIEELGYKIDQLLQDNQVIDDNIAVKLENIGKRIERLGAINLAAIPEYDKQKERKDYLDAQTNDLTTALTTLEDAIRKIDNETKTKFEDTFKKVNTNLGILFPKIFGGGKVALTMTSNDSLTAGVSITAEPPGKRNASVHLLSGGEKALTAIALVFAIFQINPAPFCLLDEVDAPFDDENVARFCNLIKEMAATIQFIYISHNKLSMEIADQLLGVTMQEPGVSRIVSVDIAEAMRIINN